MSRLNGKVPSYRRHRHSGQALVTLNGQDHYLGPYGSESSRSQYDRLVAEWLASDRRPPAAPAAATAVPVNQLILQFWEYARGWRTNWCPPRSIRRCRR